jgi:glycosyltransferase involved in cell wall biosynthesis
MPLVSVIIPTYQHASFIREAIDSVLRQTFKDFELIVIDDGSTDGTKEVLNGYENKLEYFYQKNAGLSAARNDGIRASGGNYISFLDADDVWLPNKLEIETKFLDQHPSTSMVYSNYIYFGARKGSRNSGFEGRSLPSGRAFRALFLQNPISSSSVLIRRTVFDKVGLFYQSLTQCEDLDMWLRISKDFDIEHVDIPLSKYRLHTSNMHLSADKNAEEFLKVQKRYLRLANLTKADLKVMKASHRGNCVGLGWWYLWNGEPKKARLLLRESINTYPFYAIAYPLFLAAFLPKGMVPWDRLRQSNAFRHLSRFK